MQTTYGGEEGISKARKRMQTEIIIKLSEQTLENLSDNMKLGLTKPISKEDSRVQEVHDTKGYH